MNVQQVNLLCDLCKECDAYGIIIDNIEELYQLIREHHIVDFNCCFSKGNNLAQLPSEFKQVYTTPPNFAYICNHEPRPYYGNNTIIFDKVFLKDYKIYLPYNTPESNEISLNDDGETIQLTSLSKLTSNDKILLIETIQCDGGGRKEIINSMALLFGCKIAPFYKGLYELVKPTNTKSAIKKL